MVFEAFGQKTEMKFDVFAGLKIIQMFEILSSIMWDVFELNHTLKKN